MEDDIFIDHEVRLMFYGPILGHTGDLATDLINSPGEYSFLDLMGFDEAFPCPFVRTELEYTKSPWIDEDLLQYSLKGIEAIKV